MSAVTSPAAWQVGCLSILPAIETHAKMEFRRLPAGRREDAIQEAVAAACVNYQLLAARGKLDVAHPGTVADFAVRRVRSGRHVGGRQDAARDVMSSICQRRHGVRVVNSSSHHFGRRIDGWKLIAVEERKVSIPDLAAFRIDFAHWLRMLTRRDRKIIAAFARGERTSAVAQRFGVSHGRISQFRRKFERQWNVFQARAL
ncbi:MAG TPA: hypothetical protein VG269_07240 [Tepidisphaeraceae bacterium]|jgi:hypothetical protein|nr:hypothetical protein [Tepidisphaeraceae bacterium]